MNHLSNLEIEKSKPLNYKIKKFQQVHIRKIESEKSTDIYEDHITRNFDDLSKIDLIFHLKRERIEYMTDTLTLDIIEIKKVNDRWKICKIKYNLFEGISLIIIFINIRNLHWRNWNNENLITI